MSPSSAQHLSFTLPLNFSNGRKKYGNERKKHLYSLLINVIHITGLKELYHVNEHYQHAL
jgi:hypothetical protein